jgi:hypothetical protein
MSGIKTGILNFMEPPPPKESADSWPQARTPRGATPRGAVPVPEEDEAAARHRRS